MLLAASLGFLAAVLPRGWTLLEAWKIGVDAQAPSAQRAVVTWRLRELLSAAIAGASVGLASFELARGRRERGAMSNRSPVALFDDAALSGLAFGAALGALLAMSTFGHVITRQQAFIDVAVPFVGAACGALGVLIVRARVSARAAACVGGLSLLALVAVASVTSSEFEARALLSSFVFGELAQPGVGRLALGALGLGLATLGAVWGLHSVTIVAALASATTVCGPLLGSGVLALLLGRWLADETPAASGSRSMLCSALLGATLVIAGQAAVAVKFGPDRVSPGLVQAALALLGGLALLAAKPFRAAPLASNSGSESGPDPGRGSDSAALGEPDRASPLSRESSGS